MIGGVNVIAQAVEGLSADALLDLSDRFKQRRSPAAVVLGSRENGTVHLVANFDDAVAEKIRAGDIVREIAPIVGGGGGGRPDDGPRRGQGSGEAARRTRPRPRADRRRAFVKVLALDFGSARTGVAVSDPTGTVARPVGVVRKAATDAGFESLLTMIREEEPALVVVGMPLTLRGDHGEQAQETTAPSSSASGRPSNCPSRPTTSASPRSSPAATTRARPPTCSPTSSSGRAAATDEQPAAVARRAQPAPRDRRRDRRRRRDRAPAHRQQASRPAAASRAAEAVPDRLPRGLHPRPDGPASHGRRPNRRSASIAGA